MKNKELFDKTVGILVNAYMNGTLEHGNCYACAVGNIIAGNCNYKYIANDGNVAYYTGLGVLTFEPKLKFDDLLTHVITGGEDIEVSEIHLQQLHQTGYSLLELERIEMAFEGVSQFIGSSYNHKSDDQWMFDGLMAVVNCLTEIHEASNEYCEQAKELFVKHS